MNENIYIDKKYFDFLAEVHMEITLKAINTLSEEECSNFMNWFNNEVFEFYIM